MYGEQVIRDFVEKVFLIITVNIAEATEQRLKLLIIGFTKISTPH